MPPISKHLDEEYEQEEEDIVLAIFLLTILGKQQRNAQKTRAYLTRPALLPNPMTVTPWQALYHSRLDKAYIKTMGLDCQVFD